MERPAFRPNAVVDWVELEVRTSRRRVAWQIQRGSAGLISYVAALDELTGYPMASREAPQGVNTPSTRFTVRIQSPQRFGDVMTALDTIEGLVDREFITVVGIEVAADFARGPGTSDSQLGDMAAQLIRQISRPAGSNAAPRLYKWKGTPTQRFGRDGLVQTLSEGYAAMYGNAGDDYVVRGYVKDYDTVTSNGKAMRIDLADPASHRARIEVRLQGKRCPVGTLNELRTFRFESIAKPYFKFSAPDPDLDVFGSMVANKLASLGAVVGADGEVLEAHAKKGRPRKTRATTKASPLNELVRQQLKDLTSRWGRLSGSRKSSKQHEISGAKGVLDLGENCESKLD